jgi:hypothetical protein
VSTATGRRALPVAVPAAVIGESMKTVALKLLGAAA